jgi:tRNA dimethylallyltransferase
LLSEIEALPQPGPTASQVIGLREARACLSGEISETAAIQKIQQLTRHYAKRQLTWFRRDDMLEPLDLSAHSDFDLLIRNISHKIRSPGSGESRVWPAHV